MSRGIKILPEPLRILDYTQLTSSYVALGTAFLHPMSVCIFKNVYNIPVLISWDGVSDDDYMPSNSSFVLDVTANKTQSQGLFTAKGTQIYIKQYGGSAATSGIFSLTCLYSSLV